MSNLELPDKVYLNGDDYFHFVLESNSSNRNLVNNVIRIVIYFNDDSRLVAILKKINESPLIHWICNISLVKRFVFNRPYWKYSDLGKKIQINEHFWEEEKTLPPNLLSRRITIKSESLLEFDVVRYPSSDTVALVMSWHHIIMDGRGSGMLLDHLCDDKPLSNDDFQKFFPQQEKRISVIQYIKNMYEVKDFIEKSFKNTVSLFSNKNSLSNPAVRIKTINFTLNETLLIDKNANINGSRFGSNSFLLACCAKIVNEVNIKRGESGTLWIPVPQDGRKRGGFGPIISNNISFLFYRLSIEDLTTLDNTVRCINNQMIEQLNLNMPKKYKTLLNMMRFVPLKLYQYLTASSYKGVSASFLYSSSGEGFWDMNLLLNYPVNNVLVLPPFLYPPGLTFSFYRFENALNMNIAYCENVINESELKFLESKIKDFLFGRN